MSLQQELARPPPVFDPYRALAGHESLVDLAQDKVDEKNKRFSTSLCQCRPLLTNPHFQSIFLKLVGDKEGVEVAKAIQKSPHPSALLWPHVLPPKQYSSRGPPISGIVHNQKQVWCWVNIPRTRWTPFCTSSQSLPHFYISKPCPPFNMADCEETSMVTLMFFFFQYLLRTV